MSWGVVSWLVDFGGAIDVEWQLTGGSPESETIAVGERLGFRMTGTDEIASNTGPMELADQIGVETTFSPADLIWLSIGGDLLWSFGFEATGDLDYLRLQFPSIESARRFGFNSLQVDADVQGDFAVFTSTINLAGAWNGGCSRMVQDEPDTLHRVEVTQSPYAPGANTHVTLGSRDRRSVRWVQVHGAYIHKLLAADSRFVDVTSRNINDPNNTLDELIRVSAAGNPLLLTIQGRPEVEVQIVDPDPRVSQYASRVGQSGRRYDVEIGFEVL
jgi:hypothetical protein